MTHAPEKTRVDVELQKTFARHRIEKRWQKVAIAALASVAMVALCLVAFQWWFYSSTHEMSDTAYVQNQIYEISSRVPGAVTKVFVDDNASVTKGQTLMELDQTEFRVKLEQAQAAVTLARRQATASSNAVPQMLATIQAKAQETQENNARMRQALTATTAEIKQSQTALQIIQAQSVQLDKQAEQAQKQQQQLSAWVNAGGLSPMQAQQMSMPLQQLQMQKQNAMQQMQALESKIASGQQAMQQIQQNLAPRQLLVSGRAQRMQIEAARQQAASAQAAIAQAEASLKEVQLLMSYTRVVAPDSGIIAMSTVKPGQRVAPGQPVMAIIKDNPWLVANFKETQYARIRRGQIADVKIASLPNKNFVGRVTSISPALAQVALVSNDRSATAKTEQSAAPATMNSSVMRKGTPMVPVKISLDPISMKGYERYIRHGMSASVSVRLK